MLAELLTVDSLRTALKDQDSALVVSERGLGSTVSLYNQYRIVDGVKDAPTIRQKRLAQLIKFYADVEEPIAKLCAASLVSNEVDTNP